MPFSCSNKRKTFNKHGLTVHSAPETFRSKSFSCQVFLFRCINIWNFAVRAAALLLFFNAAITPYHSGTTFFSSHLWRTNLITWGSKLSEKVLESRDALQANWLVVEWTKIRAFASLKNARFLGITRCSSLSNNCSEVAVFCSGQCFVLKF